MQRVHRLLDDVAPVGCRIGGLPRQQEAQLRIGREIADRAGSKLASRRDRALLPRPFTLAVDHDRQRGRDEGGNGQHRDERPQLGGRPAFESAFVRRARSVGLVPPVPLGEARIEQLALGEIEPQIRRDGPGGEAVEPARG